VYSQKQASATTTRSGAAFLILRIACCTTPLSLQASLPTESFFSGMPNRMTPEHPSSAAFCAASTALSTE
jgi:hypothetical protein